MEITQLDSLDGPALVAAFNLVYEDYVVPLRMTPELLAQHLAANAIELACSPLLLGAADEVAALALLGVRGGRGWVGGFGVAPAYRGRGLGRALMGELLHQAHGRGLGRLQLEVITTNLAAIRLYERAGFGHLRALRVLTRTAPAGAAAPAPATSDHVDIATLLAHGERLRGTHLAWQREPASILRMEGLRCLALGTVASPQAYAVYRTQGQGVQLLDLAAVDRGALQALEAALLERHPNQTLRLGNEPEESHLCPLLAQTGWHESLRQHEMALDLA